jgi:Cdc6-like AAA superfamily ATPase
LNAEKWVKHSTKYCESFSVYLPKNPNLAFSMTELFVDRQVFKESYVPDRILHRDAAIASIQRVLSGFHTHVLCIGDLGTGKTAVLRTICRNPPAGVKAVFVNCSEDNTQVRIFRAVLEQLGVTVKTGFPGDYYLRLFKAA